MSNNKDEAVHTELSTTDYRFLLMGYAIGIGNLWRFPYLVGKFGGGAFIVAYLVCLVLVACPMYLLELSWGNYTRKSTMDCMRAIRPRWIGVGWMTAFMLVMVLAYYNMLLAYSLVYLVNSFQDPLPWTADSKTPNQLPEKTSASENFWWNEVLVRYDPDTVTNGDVAFLGPLQGHLVIALLFVWGIVFFALFRGINASAKVSYVTVCLPILLMLVMLFRSVGLDGASDGIEFYIGKFDSSKLADLEMWATACGQILFSLSPGMGTAITISSCTRRDEDVYMTNLFVSVCNSSFSLIGGIAVFSILGYMAKQSCITPGLECKTVEELADTGGAGLAFVTLAEGVGQFGVTSNFFSTLFFIMLLTLGLDSTFAWVETIVTYADDYLQHIGRPTPKSRIVAATCLFFFICGLPFCTRLGFVLLDIVDHYVASYCLIIACFVESIMLRLDWGWDRVQLSIKKATVDNPDFNGQGRVLSNYWYVTLFYTVTPLCFGMFLFLFVTDITRSYEDYPSGLQAVGWFLLGVSVLFIPAGMWMYWKEDAPTFEEEHDEPFLSSQLGPVVAPSGVEPHSSLRQRNEPYKPPVLETRPVVNDAVAPQQQHPLQQPLHQQQPGVQHFDDKKIANYNYMDYTAAPPEKEFPAPPPVADFPTPPVAQLVPGYTVDTHKEDPSCPLGSVKKDNPLTGGLILD